MNIKTLFSLVAIFMCTLTYASFPVQTAPASATGTTTVQVSENKETKAELYSPAAGSGEKSQLVALLLCFFVGIIGIHRFYLGYTWQGIVQILTLGGLGIWTLIDFVRIIIGTLKPKDGEYDKTL